MMTRHNSRGGEIEGSTTHHTCEYVDNVRPANVGVRLRGPRGRPRGAPPLGVSVADRRWPLFWSLSSRVRMGSSALLVRERGRGRGRRGAGSSSLTGRGSGRREPEEMDAGGTLVTGVVGSLMGVAGWRRTGVGTSSGSGDDSTRRASSRRKRPSFHFSEASWARATRQPRYAPQRAHVHSWTVWAPVSMRRMDGGARVVLRVDA